MNRAFKNSIYEEVCGIALQRLICVVYCSWQWRMVSMLIPEESIRISIVYPSLHIHWRTTQRLPEICYKKLRFLVKGYVLGRVLSTWREEKRCFGLWHKKDSEHEISLNDPIQRNKISGILEKHAKIKEEVQNKGLWYWDLRENYFLILSLMIDDILSLTVASLWYLPNFEARE